jgi:hypothetical protein
VVAKLRQVRLGILGVEVLQHLADPTVHPHAPPGREVIVERVPHEAMREAKPSSGAGHLRQHVGGDGLVEHLENPIRAQLADSADGIHGELSAEDRCQSQQLRAPIGETIQAPADHAAHALGDRRAPGVSVAGLLEPSFGGEQLHHLVHEQRIALGLPVDGGGQRLRRLELGGELDEPGDVHLGQPGEREPAGDPFAVEFGEGRGERLAGA